MVNVPCTLLIIALPYIVRETEKKQMVGSISEFRIVGHSVDRMRKTHITVKMLKSSIILLAYFCFDVEYV